MKTKTIGPTPPAFDHSFSSCSRCYVTLRFYHSTQAPAEVTSALNVQPTRHQKIGDLGSGKRLIGINGWFLSTQDENRSRDVRAHIWELISVLTGKDEALRGLVQAGWKADILCFWESASGNGGPMLDAETMSLLGELKLDLGFDVWIE